MASWFTRAIDRVTPWNRGGELQRRQEKKKREEEQAQQNTAPQQSGGGLRVTNAQPTQRVVVDTPQLPQPKQPQNIFEDLNKGLVFNKPNNALDIIKSEASKPVERPAPGTVIQPRVKVDTSPSNMRIKLSDGRYADEIPDTPEQTLNKELDRGRSFEDIARDNRFDINAVREYATITRPNYGIKKMEKPKQSIGNKFRDVFDTNTESDKYRRQQGNITKGEEKDITLKNPGNIISRTPIVGHVTKMLNTAGAQIAQMPSTAEGMVLTKMSSDLTKEMLDAQKRGDTWAYQEAKRKLDLLAPELERVFREQDAGNTMYEKNKGGLFNAGTLYDEEGARRGDLETAVKDIALPTAVSMLDLYTLGKGSAIAEGLKVGGTTGLRVAAPNIVKASAGNFGSGALGTYAEGGDTGQAVKSGAINSLFGLIPDVGLPMAWKGFTNKVVPKFLRTGKASASEVVDELDDAAISASAEAANQALKPRVIPVKAVENIPINAVEGLPEPIRVRNLNEPKPLIQEFPGDASVATPDALVQKLADDTRAQAMADTAFDQAKTAPKPNTAIEGVTPRSPEAPYKLDEKAVLTAQDKMIDDYATWLREMGEGNGTQLIPDGEGGYYRTSNNVRPKSFGPKKATKGMWRDEAERQIRAGEAPDELVKAFNEAADPEVQAMLSKGEQPEAPVGKPITVKQANGIPVRDEVNVPQNLPETPGTVRVTEATAPNNVKSEVVAQAPAPILPKEVQEILDNPKKFNKRQVAAARNQRKLARQMAKTQEDTSAAVQRIEAAKSPNTPQGEGFAETGEFGRGRRGNAYQKASGEAEAALGRSEMADRSVDDLLAEVGTKESFTPGDRRRISAAMENIAKADPNNAEVRMVLKKLQTKSRTELGQALAMIPKVIRRSASADTLVNRWESKIARALDNPAKMADNDLAEVMRANDNFTLARDNAAKLEEQFKRTGSESDFKAWEEAHNAARKADADAKFTEVSVAKRVLKGEKGAHVNKVIDDLRKESDVNTMDLVTANMLSGTATGFRNTFGTELAGVENRLFANTRAKVTKAIFGENVGGFNRQGARMGRKVGMVKLGRDAARRAEIGGKNPLEWVKNWATTINSGGESSLQSQVYSRLGRYYNDQFKAQGLTGKDLDMRMRHAMITDPDAMGEIYLDSAMKSSGLTGLFDKGQTIEKAVTDYVGRGTDSKALQGASKLIMRIAVGFPTATGNFMYQSAKRLTMGLPSYMETGIKMAKGDKLGAAQAFERALKETGSGAAILGLGVALGKADMISGPYPSDPEERARWEREGISENSIKIGGAWYPIPQGAGMLGLPLMTGAAIGREGDSDESLKELYSPKSLSKLLPTDQIQGFLNMASGDGAPQDFKNFVASSVRASTPAGALLNQISKSFDDTKNDTTTKDLWSNIIDQVASGIPVVNNAMNIPDKLDDAGNPIQNPNPAQIAFGASSATQPGGEARSQQIMGDINAKLQGIGQYGIFDDPIMESVLDDETKLLYNQAKQGKELDESDVKKLEEALVKGVSSEGTDTAYLERGEYDTNLAVLKLKRDLMQADKTTKPSSLKDVETAIKRGEVYKEAQVPYDMISKYKDVGVEDWRKMGIPPEDEDHDPDLYDPEMYQKLWELDQKMTKAGVSYRKSSLDKNKYFLKEKKAGSGSGRGGSRLRNLGGDFGKLDGGAFAPKVQAYDTIDQQSGAIPIIRTVRPNIVHKIGSN
jgi:hypothetical protein